MRAALLVLAFSTLAATGCGAGATTYEASSAPPLSPYASGASVSSIAASPSVPQRGAMKSDLVVRPDALELGFALRETAADAQRAVAAAQAAVSEVEKRVEEATGGAATVRMCGVASAPYAPGKAEGDKKGEVSVTVDGTIEVPLAASLDYWARARLLAALTQVTRELQKASTDDGRKGASFEVPRPVVKEAEAHRAALTERWVRRVRAFAEVAQGGTVPLHIVDCAPPGGIEQQVLSLEEVALSLAIACRLDAAGGSRSSGRE
ncbi:hypothetical protein [Chondromyces crocatus]|uniref:Secreted protein n=1 Tax=Chondromyces crocatus TaxID=52 RepID=A0A0K1EAC7_CHOCO|nr:hypothetical protein [Chondromyces crocatus]AKT37825.1 uncharacterized protein CMC5_019680 [Chondromyces crocatus]